MPDQRAGFVVTRCIHSTAKGVAMKFRKKPVVIDAIQWDGSNSDEVLAFMFEDERWKEGIDSAYVGGPGIGYTPPLGTFDIPTLEGTMTAQVGDFIIRGVKGELYPCKPDIFDATYEAVEDGYLPPDDRLAAGGTP